MNQAQAQTNRLLSKRKRVRKQKVTEAISKPQEHEVDQWIAFMETAGYKLEEKRLSDLTGQWVATVFKFK